MKPKAQVLFSEEQIATRIAEIGREIGKAYEGQELTVVGLMKGCLVFMADLIRKIPTDLSVHLVRVTSQREEEAGTARRRRVVLDRVDDSEDASLVSPA